MFISKIYFLSVFTGVLDFWRRNYLPKITCKFIEKRISAIKVEKSIWIIKAPGASLIQCRKSRENSPKMTKLGCKIPSHQVRGISWKNILNNILFFYTPDIL